jgi:hypothetical protein
VQGIDLIVRRFLDQGAVTIDKEDFQHLNQGPLMREAGGHCRSRKLS